MAAAGGLRGVAAGRYAVPDRLSDRGAPQAWAAGTPVLLLQLLLGLEPDRRRQALETHAPPDLPSWVGDVRLSGVRAFGRLWDVRLRDGDVMVEPA